MSQQEINCRLLDIFSVAVEVNQQTKHTAFCEFMGHINKFDVRVYEDGWSKGANPTKVFSFYIDEDNAIESTKEAHAYLCGLLADAHEKATL